jgi:hypothetical protein
MPVGSPGSEGPANAIVISYRRDDSAGSAGRLYDNLCLHFGKSKVFMDVDAIPVGAEFVEYIVGIISNSDVLLTVIGPHWQELKNESGLRKLDDEKDVVRLEIQTALAKQVQIVPILVDAARMPRADALPPSIRDLATKNALEITHRRFADGVAELVNVIETAIAAATRRRSLDHDPRTRIAEIEKQKQLLDEELERLRTRIAAEIEAAEQQLNEEYASGRPSVDPRGLAEKPYGAFLLYSHAADSHVAASLQHGLQTIAKPWHRLRSIRVFRDASDLSATPGLWPALTQALNGSKYVVLLASPAAASSAWVSRDPDRANWRRDSLGRSTGGL